MTAHDLARRKMARQGAGLAECTVQQMEHDVAATLGHAEEQVAGWADVSQASGATRVVAQRPDRPAAIRSHNERLVHHPSQRSIFHAVLGARRFGRMMTQRVTMGARSSTVYADCIQGEGAPSSLRVNDDTTAIKRMASTELRAARSSPRHDMR
jgi:hypothetical protein